MIIIFLMPLDTLEQLLVLPEKMPDGLIMAFDFGLKRIGCAIGQGATGTATPLQVFAAKEGRPQWVQVTRLIEYWEPKTLLVGMPLNGDGSISEMARKAYGFASQLHQYAPLPLFCINEFLTSVIAERMIRESEDKIVKKTSIDSISAKIMLEIWLEEIFNQRPPGGQDVKNSAYE